MVRSSTVEKAFALASSVISAEIGSGLVFWRGEIVDPQREILEFF